MTASACHTPPQGGREVFYEILQLAMGKCPSPVHLLAQGEWEEVYALCERHALEGVGFAALLKVSKRIEVTGERLEVTGEREEVTGEREENGLPEVGVTARWVHRAEEIREKNRRVTDECRELCERLERDGFEVCVLKGQSNRMNYPEDLRDLRAAGDIDILMRAKEEPKAIDRPINYCIDQCRRYGKEVGKICYHHMDMPWPNHTEVEAHHRASWFNSPIRNKRLQRWLEMNMPFEKATCPDGFPVPTNEYNAVYQLLHIYRHLFEQGIGLRQLMDYYYVVCALEQAQKEHVMRTLSGLGLARFAAAVMEVMRMVFRMAEEEMLCAPDEKEGQFLLGEIMRGGNFGKWDDRIRHGANQMGHAWEKTKHNARLLTHYPEEVIWEPYFRLYHWLWRHFEWWQR